MLPTLVICRCRYHGHYAFHIDTATRRHKVAYYHRQLLYHAWIFYGHFQAEDMTLFIIMLYSLLPVAMPPMLLAGIK